MVVLETTIMLKDEILVEQLYPGSKTGTVMDKDLRNALLYSIGNLAELAFKDELQSLNVGEHLITQFSRKINPVNDKSQIDILKMYTIAEKKTNRKDIIKCMETAMNQFLDRYSIFDIYNHKKEQFEEFGDRFNKIFEKLIYSTEERLRSVF